MAGYYISSICKEYFEHFCKSLDEISLRSFQEGLEPAACDSLSSADPLHGFNNLSPDEATKFLKKRITSDDWYADLTPSGCILWEACICHAAAQMDMRPEINETVHWWVWDMISEAFGCEHNGTIDPNIPFSYFANRPFGYIQNEFFDPDNRIWVPFHSLHDDDEVAEMSEDLDELAQTVDASNDEHAKSEFHEQFAPAINRIADEGRMMIVMVDN